MTDEQLKRIEQEIMASIDGDVKKEQMLIELSSDIATKLTTSGETRAEIEGLNYKFKAKMDGRYIIFLVACIEKYKIAQEKYRPYTVTAEVNNSMTQYENLRATVEAFLRHILNMISPQEVQ